MRHWDIETLSYKLRTLFRLNCLSDVRGYVFKFSSVWKMRIEVAVVVVVVVVAAVAVVVRVERKEFVISSFCIG